MRNLFELLDFRARFDPQGCAAAWARHMLTFEQMRLSAKAIARKLRAAGVQPGQVVATALADKGHDWIVTLALFHEGAITVATGDYAPWSAAFDCDWIVTDRQYKGERSPNVILLGEEPLDRSGLGDFERRDYASEDSVARIFLTSGTTGQGKGVPLTIAQLLGRARASMLLPGGRRLYCRLGMSTASDFNAALVCLMVGSPHFVFPPGEGQALIRAHGVDCVTGSPSTLSSLVKQIAASGRRLDRVKTVRVVGAAAAPALVRALHEHTGAQVVNYYGSTEAGGIAAMRCSAEDEAITGFAQIDAVIEIVDDAGGVIAPGKEGLVRTRTPFMAAGYWRNDAETAKSFREGFFYPGDRGMLRPDGALVLRGRDNEVINFGGGKIDPSLLDQALAEWPGVQDAAVFSSPGALGADKLMVCLAADESFDTAALSAMLAGRFGSGVRPSGYVRMAAVPRNAMGKPLRAELSRRFAAGEIKPA